MRRRAECGRRVVSARSRGVRGVARRLGACLVFRLWGTADEKFLGTREGLLREAHWCEKSLISP